MKRRLSLIGISWIWICSLFAQINTERVMSVGKNALFFEDYVLSMQYFNQVINAKPYLAEAYFYRGLAKLNLEDYIGAEADCDEAIGRNPFVVNAYQVRGIARIRQNKYKEAIGDYKKALKMDPVNTTFRHNLALCYIHLEEYADARAQLDTLTSIHPRYIEGYMMKTEISLRQKDTVQAMSDADKAIEVDRFSAEPWIARGLIYLQRAKYADADADLTEAIRFSMKNDGVYINRALARYHLRNLRGAMADYDAALEINKSNFIGHYNRGLLRAQVGEDNAAIEDFNYVLSIEPDNWIAVFNRALLRDRTGDYKGAIQDYSSVLKAYPNFMEGYAQRAQLRRRIGDIKGAQADELLLLNAQISISQGKRPVIGKNSPTRKKSDKNIQDYRSLVVADAEDNTPAYKTLYRGKVQNKEVAIRPQGMFVLSYYEKPDDVKRQVNHAKTVAQINAQRLLPKRLLLTNAEAPLTDIQIKEHTQSIDLQTRRIANRESNKYIYFARAMDYYLMQDFDNATADLNAIIEIDSIFYLAYFMRATIAYKMIEVEKDGKTDMTKELGTLGTEFQKGEYAPIIADLETVLKLEPEFAFACYNRANIAVLLKDYQVALKYYDKALKIDPYFSDAYYNRGLVHIYLEDGEQGIKDLSKAGELGIYSAYSLIKQFTKKVE